MPGGVIDTVNKCNADLEQEVHELKNQIDKSMKKKSCSPRKNVLLRFMRNHYKRKMIPEGAVWNFEHAYDDEENLGVRTAIIKYTKKASDDLGYRWPDESIEEKLIVVYKNAKYTNSLTPERKEKERKKSQKNGVRNKQNREALLAEFKDCDRLIDRELMSDEEDLHDEHGVVEKKAVLCPSWRSDEGKNFYSKLDKLLYKSKKRITRMKRVCGDQYIMEKELSKSKRTRLPSWAIIPLVEPAVLLVQPDNSEQHISPV
ncbi:hypothetical protein INT45_008920 [Circinella minor]|uniref:Uncharacterized protein n=1 Tax=Circinella minor TaxID=1195481 RepID=A0A8H7V5F4_9FUNG|nr:hypothetical protein INT45_008920 [Circinella minor]